MNDCWALVPSVADAVTVTVADPAKLLGSEICTTPACVVLALMLADVIVTEIFTGVEPDALFVTGVMISSQILKPLVNCPRWRTGNSSSYWACLSG